MTAAILLLAAGRSSRFGGQNKLLSELTPGISVLECAARSSWESGVADHLVIAVNADTKSFASMILEKLDIRGELVEGGDERQDSVKLALARCKGQCVFIHDAARPLASKALYSRLTDAFDGESGIVPVIPTQDSLIVKGELKGQLDYLDRQIVFCVQTPQIFPLAQLLECHEAAARSGDRFTDDGSLFMHFGGELVMIDGDPRNIKITNENDLSFARMLISASAEGSCSQ